MADKNEAAAALYDGIALAAGEAKEYPAPVSAQVLRDLAIAYRALAGGQQPGSVTVESK